MDPGTLEFMRNAVALKDRPRRGWQRVGIDEPESVADHTWGVALLAIATAHEHPHLDRARVLELAILHDLPEVITGDLTPGEYGSKAEKITRERRALEELVDTLPIATRALLLARFEELVTQTTPEAKHVHQLDKLEMALQAHHYHSQGRPPADLSPFFDSAESAITDTRLLDAAKRLRG